MSPLTGVLRESWAMYRRFAAHFLIISLAIYLVAAVIRALLTGLSHTTGGLVAGIVDLFFSYLVQIALVKAVQDVRDGRVDLDLGQTVRAALPFLLPAAGASILASIGIAIGFVLIIIPGLVLLTFWALIIPSIVLGGTPAMASFGQSWRTVRGFAWNVFGTLVLLFLIRLVVQFVIGLIFTALPDWLGGAISDVVAGTLIAPFQAIVISLMWYRLTSAHQGTAPTGYGSPGYPEPGYPPPPPGGYGAGPTGGYGTQGEYGNQPGGYGNVPGYDAPPAGSDNPPPPSYGSSNPPPASYGSPTPETPGNQAPPADPWENSTRADTPPANGGPGGSSTRPDNPPPRED
jgi:hypothetical protein